VDPKTQFFVDEFNRVRLFHGVNVVYKLPPYYPPIMNHFDSNSSLSDVDLENLQKWGFNMIRLLSSWAAVEPIRGQYNYTYINVLKGIIQRCAKYGIHVLLDAHQDVAHARYCGEGFPDWASVANPDPSHFTRFPFPLPFKVPVDPKTGYPSVEECLKHPFFEYYLSMDVAKVFQHLYDNVNGTRTSFAKSWAAVASVVKSEPNLLGYELLNEPFLGDIYSTPSLVVERGKADRVNLIPMYKETHEEIRKVDDEKLIFYEPMVSDLDRIGFTEGPGGAAYNNRQVFSFHVYCSVNDPHGDPKSKYLCHLEDEEFFMWREKNIKAIGGGYFLTEFGAVSQSPQGVDEVSWVVSEAEKRLYSWAYWQFKYYGDFTTASRPGTQESFYDADGNLQFEKVKKLSRTYAQATCGNLISSVFNDTSAHYKLVYKSGDCKQQPTEIYLNEQWYYPKGFSASVIPSTAATVNHVSTNMLHIVHAAALPIGTEITVEIYAGN